MFKFLSKLFNRKEKTMTTYVNVRHSANTSLMSALAENIDPETLTKTFEDQIKSSIARHKSATHFKIAPELKNTDVEIKLDLTSKMVELLTKTFNHNLDATSKFLEMIKPAHALTNSDIIDLNKKMANEIKHQLGWFHRKEVNVLLAEMKNVWGDKWDS